MIIFFFNSNIQNNVQGVFPFPLILQCGRVFDFPLADLEGIHPNQPQVPFFLYEEEYISSIYYFKPIHTYYDDILVV